MLTVAVGLSPRIGSVKWVRRGATVESASGFQASLRDAPRARNVPWAEAHGYPHGVAPRPWRQPSDAPSFSRARRHAGAADHWRHLLFSNPATRECVHTVSLPPHRASRSGARAESPSAARKSDAGTLHRSHDDAVHGEGGTEEEDSPRTTRNTRTGIRNTPFFSVRMFRVFRGGWSGSVTGWFMGIPQRGRR